MESVNNQQDERITIIDKRVLPMIIDPLMAFQKDLGYVETGFLFWLLSLDHVGRLQEVYKKKRYKDRDFDENIDYLIKRNYIEIKDGRLLVS